MQTPSSQSSVAITEAGFGERLKLERTTQGISQKALAELLTAAGFAIDGPGLSRLENGTRSIRLGEAAAIAEVLDVPLVWMVGGTPRSQLRELRRIANRSIDAAVEGLASATMDCYLIQELLERHPDLLSEFTPDEDAGTLTDPSQYIAWVSVRARRVAGDPEGARITWSDKEESDARMLARAIAEGVVLREDDEEVRAEVEAERATD